MRFFFFSRENTNHPVILSSRVIYLVYSTVFAVIIMTLSLLLAVVYYPLPILYAQTDGLAAAWSLDGNANDSVGPNHGTVSGATLTAGHDDTANGAYSFNGTSDYINLGSSKFGLDQTNEMTLALWVKVAGDSPTVYRDPIIGRSEYARPFALNYYPAGNRIESVIRLPSSVSFFSTTNLSLNQWYHLALTYKDGSAILYINGAQDASTPAAGALGFGSSASDVTLLGAGSTAVSSGHFNGAIDEVRIYNRSLSASEIQSLYSGSTPTPPPACTENWNCDPWSTCTNDTQTRVCADANSCGTTTNRPALSQSCTVSCTENWSCTDWSICTNSSQTRTCTDANNCGTTTNRPALSQSCTVTPSPVSADCTSSAVRCVDDTAGSTQEYLTIQAAVNAAIAGDTVLVYPGTYRESVKAKSGVKIQSQTEHAAVLDGAEALVGGWTQVDASIWRHSLPVGTSPLSANVFQGNQRLHLASEPELPASDIEDFSLYWTVPAGTATTITDTRIGTYGLSLIGAYALVWRQTSNTVAIVPVLSVAGNTATISNATETSEYALANDIRFINQPGEYAIRDNTLYVYPFNSSDLDSITRSVRLSGFDVRGTTGVTIEGFTIQKFTGQGNGVNAYSSSSARTSDLVVRNNLCRFGGPLAVTVGTIQVVYADRVTIEGNRTEDNTRSQGVSVGLADQIDVLNNEITGAGGTTIYFGTVTNSRIIGNWIVDNASAHGNGITVYQDSHDVVVANNYVQNSNIALTLSSVQRIWVINNVLDAPTERLNASLGIWAGTNSNFWIINNWMKAMLHTSNIPGIIFINNLMFPYTAKSGETMINNIQYSVNGDSTLYDLTTHRLVANSRAIDAGANPAAYLPAGFDFTKDLDGNQRLVNSLYDIGPYEYNSGQPSTPPPTQCTESWSCAAWSACLNGTQTRTCTDVNSCGTTVSRPVLSQSCTVPPPVCTPSWSCTSWTSCSVASAQSRVCTDLNACGVTTGKPTESQACTYTPPISNCTSVWSCTAFAACSPSGTHGRACTDLHNCNTDSGKPVESQACTYTAPAGGGGGGGGGGTNYTPAPTAGGGAAGSGTTVPPSNPTSPLPDVGLGNVPVTTTQDLDGDSLTNDQEIQYNTDPQNWDTDFDSYSDGQEVANNFDPLNPPVIININTALVNRLKGYILLQVQQNGEAWYVHPVDGKRYYLRNGNVAYQIMRFLSLGITDQDLSTIATDTEVARNNALTRRLKGYILLQVQRHGEAWYVNPFDSKRYYMKDGAVAYSLMRFHSLGITNADLEKIPIGTLRGED